MQNAKIAKNTKIQRCEKGRIVPLGSAGSARGWERDTNVRPDVWSLWVWGRNLSALVLFGNTSKV